MSQKTLNPKPIARTLSPDDEEVHYPEMLHTYLTVEQVKLFKDAARKSNRSVSAFLRHSAEQAAKLVMEEP